MKDLKTLEAWFVTGSQHLYGDETLKQVARNSTQIADALDRDAEIPVKIVFKPVLTGPDAIARLCLEANASEKCIGLITWMHTFSPAKMWIAGLKSLQKPVLHLHTQFNRDLPWDQIDMDFMNLNQAAHGDREYGFIMSRMRMNRKVVVGHWTDPVVVRQVAVWARAAAGWNALQGAKVARFGDNMREVAVTEGDKVEAQMKLGFSVNGYGVGDLVAYIKKVDDAAIERLLNEYDQSYDVAPGLRKGEERRNDLREAARIELGMKNFLEAGSFSAFTTTFEDLHGLVQLPGLAVQRLMAQGYGFGAEGDWKTAAMVYAGKVMASGLKGGTSFMEDYTYHLDPSGMRVLGAHMLEVCETIASARPSLEIHPLGIGGKSDPARLVFNVPEGNAVNVSLVDMGNRFRLIVNEVKVVDSRKKLPKLPVARAIWIPQPDLQTGAAAWIYAGGAHHTVFTQALSPEYFDDFAEMAGLEYLLIGEKTNLADFRKELKWNELYYAFMSR